MIFIEPTPTMRKQARREAKDMGSLRNSFTRGQGNETGMMGEIVIHHLLGGERVGNRVYAYDLVLPNGVTVDVKTTRGSVEPLPHYVARVYGSEKDKEKLCAKCDVYYFVRCNSALSKVYVVGWLPARSFIEQALFLPKGHINPDDGKLSFADEYTLPISELNPPKRKITKRTIQKSSPLSIS
jgi:hypothetical protein